MSDLQPKPAKVCLEDIPSQSYGDASSKVHVRRLITRDVHGSELALTVATLDAGARTSRWSSMPENDAGPGEDWYGPIEETYFCTRGHLTLTWDEGTIEFGPDEAVYLAPGWHYVLENTGDETAFFIYTRYPS